jgi:hypothetical protein
MESFLINLYTQILLHKFRKGITSEEYLFQALSKTEELKWRCVNESRHLTISAGART